MHGDTINVTETLSAAHLDFLAGVAGAVEQPEVPGALAVERVTMPLAAEGVPVEEQLFAIPEVRDALAALEDAVGIEVCDRAGFAAAGAIVARLKKGSRAALKFQKDGRTPLISELRAFDDECATVIEAILTAESRVGGAMTTWRQAEEVLNAQLRTEAAEMAAVLQEQLNAKARAAGLAEAPTVDVYIGPPPKTVDTPGSGGKVTVTSRWTYEVEDDKAVPREYCAPSPGLLRAAVNRGVRSIPGVRIFSADSVGYRSK